MYIERERSAYMYVCILYIYIYIYIYLSLFVYTHMPLCPDAFGIAKDCKFTRRWFKTSDVFCCLLGLASV